MLKRKIEPYLQEWAEKRKTALLIKGARQIGKTTSIRVFIKSHFKHTIEINFADRPDLLESFYDFQNADQLIMSLSAHAGEEMIPNETCIFFDEIQRLYTYRETAAKKIKKPLGIDILTAIKSQVSKGDYRFVFSGSLLGVCLKDIALYPLGYLDEHVMYPLDFEEFLWAKGVGKDVIEHLQFCFQNRAPVETPLNNLMLSAFREYVLVGGMPEAVSAYLEQKNLYTMQMAQQQVLARYDVDITQYVLDNAKKLRVKEIYRSIPSELNSKNKRFVSSHVADAAYLKNYNLVDEFLWLTNAGIAIPVYNIDEPIIPLGLSCNRKTLKLFLNDVGLLGSVLFNPSVRSHLLRDELEINYGAPYENAAAEELSAHGYEGSIFYYNSKKNGEVDFVIETNDGVLPIEIKSGKPSLLNTYDHSALTKLMSNYDLKKAYVFGETNVVCKAGPIIQYPIYFLMFIKKDL